MDFKNINYSQLKKDIDNIQENVVQRLLKTIDIMTGETSMLNFND